MVGCPPRLRKLSLLILLLPFVGGCSGVTFTWNAPYYATPSYPVTYWYYPSAPVTYVRSYPPPAAAYYGSYPRAATGYPGWPAPGMPAGYYGQAPASTNPPVSSTPWPQDGADAALRTARLVNHFSGTSDSDDQDAASARRRAAVAGSAAAEGEGAVAGEADVAGGGLAAGAGEGAAVAGAGEAAAAGEATGGFGELLELLEIFAF